MVPLGIVPTISNFISHSDTFFEMHLYNDEKQALYALEREQVLGIVIDRRLPLNSKPQWNEVILIDGYTLVKYKGEALIKYDDLAHVRVNTYIEDYDLLEKLFPDTSVIYQHGDITRASNFAFANDEPVFIKWSDMMEGHYTLSPIDENHRLVLNFRTPVLYHTDLRNEEINILKSIIKN